MDMDMDMDMDMGEPVTGRSVLIVGVWMLLLRAS